MRRSRFSDEQIIDPGLSAGLCQTFGVTLLFPANQAAAVARMSRSWRGRWFSRRSRVSSSRSAVVGPSVRFPAQRSACRTQLMLDCAVGSDSRERSSGVPLARPSVVGTPADRHFENVARDAQEFDFMSALGTGSSPRRPSPLARFGHTRYGRGGQGEGAAAIPHAVCPAARIWSRLRRFRNPLAMTINQRKRFFYRRTDEAGPSSEALERSLSGVDGLEVLDVRDKSILFEADESRNLPEFPGRRDFEVRRIPVPDARPKIAQ